MSEHIKASANPLRAALQDLADEYEWLAKTYPQTIRRHLPLINAREVLALADSMEGERLRAALTEIRDLHQPMWVSEQAKAAGKEPWVCETCGVADGSWPCATRLTVDEVLGDG